MTSTVARTAGADTLVTMWRDRIAAAREAQKPYIPTILSNLAFAAGQHWLVYDRRTKRLRHIADVDPKYRDRELYTADRITEYRDAQLGELSSDDDRPDLLAAQDGNTAEDAAHELNQAVAHGWNHEWGADEALRTMRRYVLDMGVAAIRCRWNPNLGSQVGYAPMQGNDPAPADAIMHLAQTGQMPDGSLPRFKPVREGRSVWETYSALQLLTPPGVNHEDRFPWEILVRPVLIDDLIDEYGSVAAGLSEDGDIASAMGLTVQQQAATGQTGGQGRLRDHVWLYTCFQRPSRRYPDGMQLVIGSNRYVLLDVQEQLDYQRPNGEPHTGVVYYHWRRRSDRFMSGSFIENLKDPQRIINRRETQNLEIVDRGMPRHYLRKGDLPETPAGVPHELVELSQNAQAPTFFAGAGPGAWMYEDLAHHADNLAHASTLSQIRLGEAPPNADTYSALVLLNGADQVKRQVMQIEHRAATNTLVELSVFDMQRYWPAEKKILVHGDGDQVRFATFQKARIPAFFMCKVANGPVVPTTVGAELKKVDAIWAAAVQCGVAVQQNVDWINWYEESVAAGSPQPLPKPDQDSQQRMAQLENELMRQGIQPAVADYDLLPAHLPEHRAAQDQARAEGNQEWLARLDQHVADHVAQQQQNANMVAQARQIPGAGGPASPPGPQMPQPQFAAPDFLRIAAGNP